jgi:putative hydrolase of the HAD superfamily
MAPPIRGLLLDAGDVLYFPVGGRWNPRLDFEGVVARFSPAHDPARDPARFSAAVAAGDRYFNEAQGTGSREEYHRVVLAVLGIADPPAALLAELDRPLDYPFLELFPEVHRVLTEIRRRGFPIAIVSDNSPGAEKSFDFLGIGQYIDAHAISGNLGCCKPDPRMYAAGSTGIGVPPAECLFVDNDHELVEAAVALGYQGVALGRTLPHPPARVPWIESLDGVLDWLGPAVGEHRTQP